MDYTFTRNFFPSFCSISSLQQSLEVQREAQLSRMEGWRISVGNWECAVCQIRGNLLVIQTSAATTPLANKRTNARQKHKNLQYHSAVSVTAIKNKITALCVVWIPSTNFWKSPSLFSSIAVEIHLRRLIIAILPSCRTRTRLQHGTLHM